MFKAKMLVYSNDHIKYECGRRKMIQKGERSINWRIVPIGMRKKEREKKKRRCLQFRSDVDSTEDEYVRLNDALQEIISLDDIEITRMHLSDLINIFQTKDNEMLLLYDNRLLDNETPENKSMRFLLDATALSGYEINQLRQLKTKSGMPSFIGFAVDIRVAEFGKEFKTRSSDINKFVRMCKYDMKEEETNSSESQDDKKQDWLLGRIEDEHVPYVPVKEEKSKEIDHKDLANNEGNNTGPHLEDKSPISTHDLFDEPIDKKGDQSEDIKDISEKKEESTMGGQEPSKPKASDGEKPESKAKEKGGSRSASEDIKPEVESLPSVSEAVNKLRESGLTNARLQSEDETKQTVMSRENETTRSMSKEGSVRSISKEGSTEKGSGLVNRTASKTSFKEIIFNEETPQELSSTEGTKDPVKSNGGSSESLSGKASSLRSATSNNGGGKNAILFSDVYTKTRSSEKPSSSTSLPKLKSNSVFGDSTESATIVPKLVVVDKSDISEIKKPATSLPETASPVVPKAGSEVLPLKTEKDSSTISDKQSMSDHQATNTSIKSASKKALQSTQSDHSPSVKPKPLSIKSQASVKSDSKERSRLSTPSLSSMRKSKSSFPKLTEQHISASRTFSSSKLSEKEGSVSEIAASHSASTIPPVSEQIRQLNVGERTKESLCKCFNGKKGRSCHHLSKDSPASASSASMKNSSACNLQCSSGSMRKEENPNVDIKSIVTDVPSLKSCGHSKEIELSSDEASLGEALIPLTGLRSDNFSGISDISEVNTLFLQNSSSSDSLKNYSDYACALCPSASTLSEAQSSSQSGGKKKEIELSLEGRDRKNMCVIRILMPEECTERIMTRTVGEQRKVPQENLNAESPDQSTAVPQDSHRLKPKLEQSREVLKSRSIISFPDDVAAPKEESKDATRDASEPHVEYAERKPIKNLISFFESFSKKSNQD